MKYTVQSSKYVFKNFIYLFPFAILPALFLAFSTDVSSIVSVIRALFSGEIRDWSFSVLFRAISVLNFARWQSIVFGIVGIIVIIPCVALLMALLEKHMRIGRRTFNGLWGKLNDNFMSTCGVVFLVLAVYELWTLLLSACLFLLSRITVTVVAYTLVIFVYIAFHLLLMVAVGTIYLWLPCMQITGFRAFEALLYSYQLINPVRWKIALTQITILFSVETLVCLCAVFVPTEIAFWVVAAILYASMIMVYCVRMQIMYFDRDNIERADTAKYYQR